MGSVHRFDTTMSKGFCGVVGKLEQLARVIVFEDVDHVFVKLVAFLPMSVQAFSKAKVATEYASLGFQVLALAKGFCGVIGKLAQLARVIVFQHVEHVFVKVLVAFLPLSVQAFSITKVATASRSLGFQVLALALVLAVWFRNRTLHVMYSGAVHHGKFAVAN